MGLDEAQAVIGSPRMRDNGANSTESNFKYAVVDKTGHKINTKRPVLFELGDKKEFHKNLFLVAIFKKVLPIRSKHVVLHFDTEASTIPKILNFAIEYHSNMQKKITMEYEDFASSKEFLLGCNYPMFRGLEGQIITAFIDRDIYIYFTQHYLVEMLSRFTSKRYVVVLQSAPTLKKVTMEWKIKELVNQLKTEIFKNDIQRDECVVEKNENQNIITATFQSKYCRKLKEVWK